MHRFYLPPAECAADSFALTGSEAHHALHVLRVREGERVAVLDGAGNEILCEVRRAGKRDVTLKVVQKHAAVPLPYQVTLAQAVVRGRAMDLIVQKATELGVHRIVPIISDRIVSRADGGAAAGKAAKWETAAIEAIKQCGSPWLPRIEPPLALAAFLARREEFDLAFVASLQPGARHPRDVFEAFEKDRKRMPRSVLVWVGPEGDFTLAEIDSIRAAGARPVTLGRFVLRADTAAIYCLSVIHYELQARLR